MSWPVPSAVMYARAWPVAGLVAVATAYKYEGSRSLGVGGLTKFRMLVLCGTMVGVPNATAFLAVVRLPAPSTDTAFRARPYSVVTRTVPSALTAKPRSYAALAPVNLDVLAGGAWEGRSTVAA